MRADTRTISIEAPPSRAFAFLKAPENLPRWAVGFAKSVRQTEDGWYVMTGAGEIRIRIDPDERTGVVDFHLQPSAGADVLAASRIIPRGQATEFAFTQFQSPGMPDAAFAQSVRALEHELTVLKALLEVGCPL